MRYRDWQVYLAFLRINFLSGLQYKGWVVKMVSVLLNVITDPIAVFLGFARFGPVGDYTAARVMLVYAMALTSFGLAEVFSRGFDVFPYRIKSGEFDRILLRPRNTFIQVVGMAFHIHRLARVAGGVFMIGLSLNIQGTPIGVMGVLQIFLSLAGGYLTYTGVFIISSAVVFVTIEPLDWVYIFTNGSYQVAKAPPDKLPGFLKNTFIFVMPMLLFSYYPASAICGWGAPKIFGWLGLPAGFLFFAMSVLVWSWGVKKYSSAGS